MTLVDIDEQTLFHHLEVMSSDEFAGRKMGSKGSVKAQKYIINTLQTLKIKPLFKNYQQPFKNKKKFSYTNGHNIIAAVKGKLYPDQYIILSAHFDHLGHKGQTIYNGADDNASGTAALLTLAEIIASQPTNYSIIFLFTDGEEANLLGAKAFAKSFPEILTQTKLNINIDMIAGTTSGKSTRVLRYVSYKLDTIIAAADYKNFVGNQQQFLTIKKGFRHDSRTIANRQNWKIASDHGVFYHAKIPFLYFGVGTHKNYHTDQDTFEHVNLPFFLTSTQVIYQQVVFIDNNII